MAETFNIGPAITAGPVPEGPTFFETVEATLGRTLDPIINTMFRQRFGSVPDPNYDFKKYTLKYQDYGPEFAALPNDAAAVDLSQQIDRSMARRQVLGMATLGQSILAGFFDPINYLGIPFAGRALTIGRAALRSSVSVAAFEVVREGAILTTDPTAPALEAAFNIASSAMFGAAAGAAFNAPPIRRAEALQKSQEYLTNYYKLVGANENAVGINPEMYASRLPKKQRPNGSRSTEDINAELTARTFEAEALRAQAEAPPDITDAPDAPQRFRDQAASVDKRVVDLRNELGIRFIEDSGFNVDDPFGLPANWLTDSIFYKIITTPMKRALQSSAPTSVKKMFVGLAYDMGQILNLHTYGVTIDPSVHMRTVVSHGQMVKFETELKALYGEVKQNPLSFDDWADSVSRKRIAGDENLSEIELKAASVIESYFGGPVTVNLEDLGLISTARGRESKIRIISREIDALTVRRVEVESAVDAARLSRKLDGNSDLIVRLSREIEIIDARIDDLKKDSDGIVRIAINDPVKLAEYESAMTDIVSWNKKWMNKTIVRLQAAVKKDRPLFKKLDALYKSNSIGLTPEQVKLYNDIAARLPGNEKTLAEFQGLTEKIKAAKSVDDLIKIKDELDVTPRMAEAMDTLSEAIDALRVRIDGAKAAIDASNVEPKAEPHFSRFYKHDKIRANREAFIQIVMREFEKKPYVYDFNYEIGDHVPIKLSTDPVELRKRAESTTDRILSEGDPVNSGDVIPGLGRSKHFRHRTLDIPTSAIIDYIETNPISVFNSYNARVRPRALFQEKFGKDYNGVKVEMELEMLRSGAGDAEINAMRRDFDALYRRIVSNVLDNPDALNQKIAYALRTMAGLTFMGGAGLSSIPDFGRIVMQYDLAPLVKGVQSMIDMDTLRLSGDETKLAGSALEYVLGMYRLESQMSNNFVAPRLLNSAQHMFYVANGLTPLTIAYKKLSGLVMAHTLIDYSIRLTNGTISEGDRVFLAMHGINDELAARLAKAPWQRNKEGLILPNTEQWADHIEIPEIEGKRITVIEEMEDGSSVGKKTKDGFAPAYYNRKTNTIYFDRDFIEGPMFQQKSWLKPRLEGVNALPDIFKTPKQWANFVMLYEVNHSRFSAKDLGISGKDIAAYENKINELAMADYKAAQKISINDVEVFRAGLNAGITNTVIHGSPADRPIITDGVVHIPMSIAGKFGFKEHPVLKGYARIENGFLGLPFQFYNFLFGSMNKTAAAMAHGQVKNRAIGAATMLGLAYMILKAKTSEGSWDNMSFEDKMARSIDASGLIPFYSDLFYRTMHTTAALGGPNITGDFLKPKFKQRESVVDAVTDLAGAGPSWAAGVGEGLFKVINGDYGNGSADLLRMLPLSNMWFWKGEVSELAQAMRG